MEKNLTDADSLQKKSKIIDFFGKAKEKIYFSGFPKSDLQVLVEKARGLGLELTGRVEDCKYLVSKCLNTGATQSMRQNGLRC